MFYFIDLLTDGYPICWATSASFLANFVQFSSPFLAKTGGRFYLRFWRCCGLMILVCYGIILCVCCGLMILVVMALFWCLFLDPLTGSVTLYLARSLVAGRIGASTTETLILPYLWDRGLNNRNAYTTLFVVLYMMITVRSSVSLTMNKVRSSLCGLKLQLVFADNKPYIIDICVV